MAQLSICLQYGMAHAKIHFYDPDGNSLEFICKILNPTNTVGRMYLSDWEAIQS